MISYGMPISIFITANRADATAINSSCTIVLCWPLCALTIRATLRRGKARWTSLPSLGAQEESHGVCQMLYRHGWSVTL
jgi:hypothetical protein